MDQNTGGFGGGGASGGSGTGSSSGSTPSTGAGTGTGSNAYGATTGTGTTSSPLGGGATTGTGTGSTTGMGGMNRDEGSAGVLTSGGRPGSEEGSERGGSATPGGVKEALGQVQNRVDSLMDRGAETLETASERIGQVAQKTADRGGIAGRAGGVAQGAADLLESVGRYLRDNDATQLQDDLVAIVDRRPFQSLLVAVAAGWVVGKILR